VEEETLAAFLDQVNPAGSNPSDCRLPMWAHPMAALGWLYTDPNDRLVATRSGQRMSPQGRVQPTKPLDSGPETCQSMKAAKQPTFGYTGSRSICDIDLPSPP
jgi:hypothetical protein